MKTFGIAIAALSCLAWLPIAHAGGQISGKISIIHVFPAPYNVAMLKIQSSSTTIPGTPACNTNAAFAFSIAEGSGRTLVNQLLHAQTMGYAVTVIGSNACDVWLDRETVLYVYVVYP